MRRALPEDTDVRMKSPAAVTIEAPDWIAVRGLNGPMLE